MEKSRGSRRKIPIFVPANSHHETMLEKDGVTFSVSLTAFKKGKKEKEIKITA